jgi:hypothetical protein
VFVGVPQLESEAASCWPVDTGGLWPPLGSQPYEMKLESFCFTPITKALSFATVAAGTEPYRYLKDVGPLSNIAIS